MLPPKYISASPGSSRMDFAGRSTRSGFWRAIPTSGIRRLIARHESYGRTPRQARDRALGSDERNAVLVNATAEAADLVIR